MVSRESLMYHSKLDSGVPSSLYWTQCLYCHRVSGLLARPGASHAANGDCSDRCALEVAFYQLPASDHRTLGSAAGVGSQKKPWQWLVTQGHQQMFLSLTVADLASHLTAGTALLGPWLQGWGKKLRKQASRFPETSHWGGGQERATSEAFNQ